MENKMPTMPTINNKEENVKTSLPGAEEIETPVKEFLTKEKNDHSVIDIPKSPKGGIEVVATRKGFYNQRRINVGHKFKIKDFSSLGEWMECVDPSLEKERKKYFKNKKTVVKQEEVKLLKDEIAFLKEQLEKAKK